MAILSLHNSPSQGKDLLDAWCDLVRRIDEAQPAEWFCHFTFADNVHPEQGDRRFRRFLRVVNEAVFGRRFRERGQGTWAIRATEYQARGVLHYHAIMGGGVRQLRRHSYRDEWEREGGGFCRIFPYDREQGAVRYVTKYAVKGGEIDLFVPPTLEQLLRGGLLQEQLRRV